MLQQLHTTTEAIMKKADIHILVAMMATLVSMFTVFAILAIRFFG